MKAMPTYNPVIPLSLGQPQHFRRMLCLREVPGFPTIQPGKTYLVEKLRTIGGKPHGYLQGINDRDENKKRKPVPLSAGEFEPCVHSVDEIPQSKDDWNQIRNTLKELEGRGS